MNRREALYVMGGMIGVSIFSANKYFDYRDKINKRALNTWNKATLWISSKSKE